MTFSERGRERKRERQKARAEEREKLEEKNNSLTLGTVFFFFFAQPLFPWKPYHMERDGERRCIEKRREKQQVYR